MIENGFRFFSGKNEIVVSINQGQDVQRVNVNENMAKTLTEIESLKLNNTKLNLRNGFQMQKKNF